MKVINHTDDIITYRKNIQEKTVGLIPTMGALHAGHLSLIEQSKKECDVTIVSIFINPAQFSIDEDLNTYPFDIDTDKKLLLNHNVDVVFIPRKDTIYPDDFSTYIIENQISTINEGQSRPLFFRGVLTIVSKLFNIIQPTHAFFGMKDAQQLAVVEKMVNNLNYNINIVRCPTIREENGLAMSSRNQYLTNKQKTDAAVIYKSLLNAVAAIDSGEKSVKKIVDIIEECLNYKEIKIDYISLVNQSSFNEIEKVNGDVIILIAVFFNNVRLIDNIYYSLSSR